MSETTVNVGIIGGGLMGREVAMALGRWGALLDHPVQPRLRGVCDINPAALSWFERLDGVETLVTDYHDLLADDSLDVLYIAVRHDLHRQLYLDAIAGGKDFLGEKPFGIDLAAANDIAAALEARPDVFVRCSSEFPYYPGAQAAIAMIASGELGPLIELESRFHHSSDLDPAKPINWKRQARYCGAPGVMNDLGMHVVHAPLRLGLEPETVYAILQNLVPERPGPDGEAVICDTYENATMLCTAREGGRTFPLTLSTKRIDPGQKNTWQLRATGMAGGVAFSSRYPKTLSVMRVDRGEQVWQEVEMGSQSVFPTVTGAIFETGFSDAMLQMWAAFLAERAGALDGRFGCVTPAEAVTSHRIWEAALRSQGERRVVALAEV